jgi:riboflavin synthase
MFTGLIEEVGRLRGVSHTRGGLLLEIEASFAREVTPGESVAVSGVCLTVIERTPRSFRAEVVRETIDRTYLASLRSGDLVNLERALRAGDRMGGHFVLGHVDGIGTIVSLRAEGEGRSLAVRHPSTVRACIVEKGSIALDGVSLTIARFEDGILHAALIPATLERTTFGCKRRGDLVHVEGDMIGKFVARSMTGGGRPEAWYRENGYE